MFGYFKRKREERQRAEQLKQLGETMGEHLRAELELFIQLEIAPRRAGFIDVFRGQLQSIDERLIEFDAAEEVSRVEAAGIDYRIMLENWNNGEANQLERAKEWLGEQFAIAEAAAVESDYLAAVKAALADQKLALMSEALEVLIEIVPEAIADHDDSSRS